MDKTSALPINNTPRPRVHSHVQQCAAGFLSSPWFDGGGFGVGEGTLISGDVESFCAAVCFMLRVPRMRVACLNASQ